MGRGGSKWKTIKQFPSWKEAKAAPRKGTIEGKWEWASNSSSPITGRRAYYKCAAHVGIGFFFYTRKGQFLYKIS